MRDGLKFEQIFDMLIVDQCFGVRVIAHAGADISVEYSVCESEVVLIGLTTETVRRCFLHQVDWQAQFFTHGDNFLYGESP